MSSEISELIIPGTLFAPTAQDHFSLISGGMPNGDDCIRIDGATSTDHGAYQDSLLGLGHDANNHCPGASISFWFKIVSGVSAWSAWTASGAGFTNFLLGQQYQYNADGNSRRSNQHVALWSDRLAVCTSFSNDAYRYADGDWDDGQWHHVVCQFAATTGTPPNLFVDGTSYATNTTAGGGHGAITGDYAYRRWGIGGNLMPDGTGLHRGVDGVVDFGKFAAWSSFPDSTLRENMYDSMLTN